MSTENSKSINENLESNEVPKSNRILQNKLKSLFIEWSSSSTSHGIPNIFKTSQLYLKIVWIICFLASSGYCFSLIISYITTFLEYGVTVSTIKVIETPINFPAVTICNLNPFYANRSSWFIQEVLNNSNLIDTNSLLSNGASAMSVVKIILEKLKIEASSNPTYTSNRVSLGFYIEDMLVSCSYSDSNCSTSDFSFFQSYDYGNCYTFNGNSSSIKTTSSAGPGNSFEIELFSGDPNNELLIYNRGFYVVVHNQSYSPLMDNEGVYVSIGRETNIGIDRSLYSRQKSPYSNCIVDPTSNKSSSSDLYQLILNEMGEKLYRQVFCYKLCYQVSVVNNCFCYDAAYPNTNITNSSVRGCHTETDLTCLASIKSSFQQDDIRYHCDNYCPIECLSVSFSTSVHTASYPTDAYLNLLLRQSSFISLFPASSNLTTAIPASVAKINVFYNDISYTALIESPTLTPDTLLGNIGGALGLFIGISLLSVVEILELLCELIRITYNHRQEKKIANKKMTDY